jgi:phosphotransferase system enzyme I (PtsI)
VLTGLGVTSLSMNASAIRAVGASLAAVTREQCETAARAAAR